MQLARLIKYFLLFIFSTPLLSQNYTDSLNYYYQRKEYDKSLYFSDIQKNILKSTNDTINARYSFLLTTIGTIYKERGDFHQSEKYYNRSIKSYSDVPNIDSLTFALLKNNLAILYRDNQMPFKAEPLFRDVLNIRKSNLSEFSQDLRYAQLNYAYILSSLGEIYYKTGNYALASRNYKKSREIYANIIGVDSHEYINVNYSFGILQQELGNYDIAKEIFLDVINQRLRTYKKSDEEIIWPTLSLASIYYDLGFIEKAKEIYEECLLNIEKNSISKEAYLNAVNGLALVYNNQENYSKAEMYLIKSANLAKEYKGVDSYDYIISLTNLASFYEDIHDYLKSLLFYSEALDLSIKIKHIPLASVIYHNLSSFWLNGGDLEKAEKYALEATNSIKNVYPINHLTRIEFLNNLYNIYSRKKEYSKAESGYLDLLKRLKSMEINEHYYSILYNLSSLYIEIDRKNKAKKYLYRILEQNNSDFAAIKMLSLLEEENDFIKSKELYEKYYSYFSNKILNFSNFMSIEELKRSINHYRYDMFFPISFLHRHPNQFDSITTGSFENQLLLKNLSLRNQQRIKNTIEKSGDSILTNKYHKFVTQKRQLTKLETLPDNERPKNYDALVMQTEQLEKELTRASSEFADAKQNLSVKWKDLQDKLKPNEAIVDLVSFNYFNKKWTDSILYGAFIVKKGYIVPKYTPLFEEKQLETFFSSKDSLSAKAYINNQYNGKALHNLVLKPIIKELEDVKTVYISPSGYTHQLDFSAIPITDSLTFGEKYKVHLLGVSSQILENTVSSIDVNESGLEILLYGDIDYDKSEETNVAADKEEPSQSKFQDLVNRSGINGWGYLPGTKKEVEQIKNKANRQEITAKLINGDKATEASIKKLDGYEAPFVLHLATHGFFFPDPEKELPENDGLIYLDDNGNQNLSNTYMHSDDPMQRSGILLAGANKYWGKNKNSNLENDGILTAKEISNLNLKSCELVVLSACETGLGEIKGSEGVFGLQRAFKMAGVKNIIMSLWKVPDTQTSELFNLFYSHYLNGKSIHASFQIAQKTMKEKYPPYYWAGFVLLE